MNESTTTGPRPVSGASSERVAGVIDVQLVSGPQSAGLEGCSTRRPSLLIEVPHGATEIGDFDRLAAELEGPHPEGLVEFFYVNTDVGAPELAVAVAEAVVRARPADEVLILRSRIPRTFVDCNRKLEAQGGPGITPGMMPWVTSEQDEALVLSRYTAYQAAVERTLSAYGARAQLLLLHTYAPRTLDIQVDASIVTSLRDAYAPGRAETWPLRPSVDLIHRNPEGTSLAPTGFLDALRTAYASIGVPVGDGETYPLHPLTLAHAHATRFPGQVTCVEVRRDLLAEDFVPLRPVTLDAGKVERMAQPLAQALEPFLGRRL